MWRNVSEVELINTLSFDSDLISMPFTPMLTDVLASSTALPQMRSLSLQGWKLRDEEADAVVRTLYGGLAIVQFARVGIVQHP